MAIDFPAIDPVLIEIGPVVIRWYALSYIAGILLGWWYLHFLNRLPHYDCTIPDPNQSNREKIDAPLIPPKAMDGIISWAIIGIILGGRLGYVLFYNFSYYIDNINEIFLVWQGGMSFHGGMIGMIIAMYLMCRLHKIHFISLMDKIACCAPIGLLLGRIANFINGELYGRVTDVSWGVLFPRDPENPRHPSQLYEAFLEGFVLFAILWFCVTKTGMRHKSGILSGIFLIGYGASRAIVEQFREPDAHIGFLSLGLTMGQYLSFPMILLGVALILYPQRKL